MFTPQFLTRQFVATALLLAWGLAPEGLAGATSARLRETLRSDLLSKVDYEHMERGYYEQLLDPGRNFAAIGTMLRSSERKGWTHLDVAPFEAGPLAQVVDDVREFVLKPNLSFAHDGALWSTNALGMRDREYESAKPPGTMRIAFVGDSIGAGWGVDDGQGFEPVLERALDERSRKAGGPAVEILNFAVPGHGPGQRWEHFSRLGWAMEPDLVVFESTLADAGWDERRLRGLLPRGVGWNAPVYRNVLMRAKVQPGDSPEAYKRALKPYRAEFLAGVFRAVVDDCRARGISAVWVLVPRVGKAADAAERQRMLALARGSGFSAVIDLSDVYEGLEPAELAIAPNDYHPNAGGHARLARRLEAALRDRPELVGTHAHPPSGDQWP